MARYASNTSVSTEGSRSEIERTLRRYGCHDFAYSTSAKSASVAFRLHNLSVVFRLPLPDIKDFERTPARNMVRSQDAQVEAWEQACRQRWRALALAIKAKLEAVECGIATFEQEFLAYVMTATGETVGERMIPHIDEIQRSNVPLLPGSTGPM